MRASPLLDWPVRPVRHRRALLALCAGLAISLLAPGSAAAEDCPPGFECQTVDVPLDRSGRIPGELALPVAVKGEKGPLLLALGGGPGQGMIGLAGAIGPLLEIIAPGYRIGFIDQRGTGATALSCPQLQRAGLTDFTVPPRGSLFACARRLGPSRDLYTTTDTVADLDAIRTALGAPQMALLGTSYGTYVAERYARAHPDRVSRLLLDSVLPQQDVDPFLVDNMRRAALTLRQLCTRRSLCAEVTDSPVRDLRRLVRRTNRRPVEILPRIGKQPYGPIRIDGPALLDLITGLASFDQDRFTVFPRAVKRALAGKPRGLARHAAEIRAQNYDPDPSRLSWGLHTATLCSDVDFPWSGSADRSARRAAVRRAAGRIANRSLRPFNRRTAVHNGVMVTCLRWPESRAEPAPDPGPLPDVPTLILNGTWDLSTPVQGARREARRSPSAQLAVLPQVGHSTLTSVPCARLIAQRFFADRALGSPCRDNRAPKRPG